MPRRVIVLLLLFVAVYPATAQQPSKERGFRPELVYDFRDLDTVNLLNGNLNVTVPLGGTYPVAAGLSYSFVLRYAGNTWRDTEWERFTYNDDREPPNTYQRFAIDENAGMGWNLSFGALQAPNPNVMAGTGGRAWRYESQDGSVHVFFPTLHEPVCSTTGALDCDQEDGGVEYTRDGSYLRIKHVGTDVKVVEFPDGRRQRFKRYETTNPEVWLLEDMYTASSELGADGRPLNAYVRFTYDYRTAMVGQNERHWYDWTVADSHGRTHTVKFEAPNDYRRRERLTSVTLAAFGGTTAAYTLEYEAREVLRRCPDDATLQLWFLTGIALTTGERFAFTYSWPLTGDPCGDSALMKSVTLPTKGSIHWTYRAYGFSVYDSAHGVATRVVKDASGEILERTDYTSQLQAATTETAHIATTTVTRCKAWTADTSVPCTPEFQSKHHHKSVKGAEFGLPFHPDVSIDTTSGKRYLSSETFDCAQSASCGVAQKTASAYVLYEMDQRNTTCSDESPCGRDRNRRVAAQRTVHDSDGARYVDVRYSDFDGLGHYRKSVTSGNFTSGNARETFVAYNSNTRGYNQATGTGHSVGTYTVNGSGERQPGFQMLGKDDPWILGTYTASSVTEGTSTEEILACFDAVTGFLKRRRAVRNRNSDLVTSFTPDADGNVAREEFFGGDFHTLPGVSLCLMTPSHNQYTFRVDHNYAAGSLQRSTYYDSVAGMAMPFHVLDDVIDVSTGLVRESRDTSLLSTAYTYDSAGRITSVDPPGSEKTTFTYVNAGTGGASVLAQTGTDAYQSMQQEYIFDAMGRLWREKRQTYDGSWVVRQTDYQRGRKSSVSEWEPFSSTYQPVKKTLFGKYDVNGRAGEITAPDGSITTFTYAGERLTTRKFQVRTGETTSTEVVVREERDAAGRLIAVTENADTAGAQTTTYAYDAGNRLMYVKMVDGTAQQERFFTYDGAGLLTQEQHPESGTTTYSYDARGHVIDRSKPEAVTFSYDAAERVTAVKDAAGQPIKEYTYYDTGAKGRLAEAKRHNRTAIGNVVVSETFEYDSGGRISRKTTAVTGAAGNTSFTDEYTYDAMGQLQALKYPTCTGCPVRTLSMFYSRGFLTDVGAYTHGNAPNSATGGTTYPITYNPDGSVRRITHANADGTEGPSYQVSNDAGIGRPGKIEVTGFCSNFVITQQPQSATVAPGASATLSVTAPGAVSFQWFQGNSTTPLAGQTTNTLTVSPSSTTTYRVRARQGNCYVDSAVATVTVQDTCNTPDSRITVNASSINGGGTASASVPDAGTNATYAWTITNGSIVSGSTARTVTFTAGCSGNVKLDVIVRNGSCDAPGSTQVPITSATATLTGSKSIELGQSAQLSVALTGVSPWTLRWSDGHTDSNVAVSPFTRTVTPTMTTTYSITDVDDAHGCGTASGQAVITVTAEPPPAPTSLIAGASSATVVHVSWSYSEPLDEFRLYRNDALIYRGRDTSYQDTGVQADRAYQYKVLAVRGNLASPESAADIATTVMFDDDPLESGHRVKVSARHITQLRTAVNAVRALAGLPAMSFERAVAKGARIKRVDLTEMRVPLNEARQLLTLPPMTFRTPLTGVIQAEDIRELRRGVK